MPSGKSHLKLVPMSIDRLNFKCLIEWTVNYLDDNWLSRSRKNFLKIERREC